MDDKNVGRIAMRTSAPIEQRVRQLMEKKGLSRPEIVNVAISEMFDREIGALEVKKGSKKRV